MGKLEIDLLPEEEVRLESIARDHGIGLDEFVRRSLLEIGHPLPLSCADSAGTVPIWMKAAALAQLIPSADRLGAPKNGAANFKIYAAKRRSGTE